MLTIGQEDIIAAAFQLWLASEERVATKHGWDAVKAPSMLPGFLQYPTQVGTWGGRKVEEDGSLDASQGNPQEKGQKVQKAQCCLAGTAEPGRNSGGQEGQLDQDQRKKGPDGIDQGCHGLQRVWSWSWCGRAALTTTTAGRGPSVCAPGAAGPRASRIVARHGGKERAAGSWQLRPEVQSWDGRSDSALAWDLLTCKSVSASINKARSKLTSRCLLG